MHNDMQCALISFDNAIFVISNRENETFNSNVCNFGESFAVECLSTRLQHNVGMELHGLEHGVHTIE
jgi:hypothetical protein